MTSIHELEEQEYEANRSNRLWDADPDVCCGAFQLGACSHTEDEDGGETYEAQMAAWKRDEPEQYAAYMAERLPIEIEADRLGGCEEPF